MQIYPFSMFVAWDPYAQEIMISIFKYMSTDTSQSYRLKVT